jgi:hypothetical protein
LKREGKTVRKEKKEKRKKKKNKRKEKVEKGVPLQPLPEYVFR